MKSPLNENIRKFRLQTGLNQVAFAKIMNVSKQCVSNWENDNVLPSIEMLCRLADFFHVSTDALLGRTDSTVIDVSQLNDTQVAHLRLLVEDLSQHNNES